MDNSEIVQRISRLEEQNIAQEKQIDSLLVKTKDVPKLEVLMEVLTNSIKEQTETNKEQTKANKELSQTLIEVKDNIQGLNGEMKNLGSEVSKLGGRVEKLESNEEEKKIDLGKLFKHVLWVAIPAIVVAAVTAYFNLK
ncbi:hypothetical protein [Metabacillus sp. Hm71]|uniref:hypothetical protein n=1 Tax=Metabacillus sp. Hm71 TaxID=3450743 RepID=UPI003F41EE22